MILVTTPNGKVGQEVVKRLLEQGETVRLAAHTPQKAQDAFSNAEVVPFEFGGRGERARSLTERRHPLPRLARRDACRAGTTGCRLS